MLQNTILFDIANYQGRKIEKKKLRRLKTLNNLYVFQKKKNFKKLKSLVVLI